MNRIIGASVSAFVTAGVANAASVNLSYIKTQLGPVWQYDMTLSVDTSASGWSPGMGWRWLIFGDVPNNGISPLAGFAMTSSFPVGPWTSLGSTSGGHNGPSFNSVLDYWIPTSATDTLHWVGTSTTNAPDGTLFFSTIAGTVGGATAADFKPMIAAPVPEPASLLVLGGIVPAFLRRRRAR